MTVGRNGKQATGMLLPALGESASPCGLRCAGVLGRRPCRKKEESGLQSSAYLRKTEPKHRLGRTSLFSSKTIKKGNIKSNKKIMSRIAGRRPNVSANSPMNSIRETDGCELRARFLERWISCAVRWLSLIILSYILTERVHLKWSHYEAAVIMWGAGCVNYPHCGDHFTIERVPHKKNPIRIQTPHGALVLFTSSPALGIMPGTWYVLNKY